MIVLWIWRFSREKERIVKARITRGPQHNMIELVPALTMCAVEKPWWGASSPSRVESSRVGS